MRKLKVGVIGVGMAFEKLHYPAFQKLSDHYVVTAISDPQAGRLRDWASRLRLDPASAYPDWREMLKRDDLDVIDILVPIPLNYEITAAVAKQIAGQRKGIICEKPLAPTLAQAKAARDLAQEHNIPIMIAENYRYNQETGIIAGLVRQKRIGDVLYFVQNRVVDFPGDMLQDKFPAVEWRQYAEFPGGAITDTALHDLAALRQIFGAIDKLHAFGRSQAAGYSPYSVVQANLLFQSGLTGSFNFFCAGREMQRPLIGLRIFGNQGMIYLEERDCGTVNVAYNDDRSEQIPYQPQAGYYNELFNFYNALTGVEPIHVTPELEYGDLKTVHAILKSIREARVVAVDETETYQPGAPPARGEERRWVQ